MKTFTQRNRPDWEELELYLKQGRKSVKRLSASQFLRLEELYRRATVQLAQVLSRTRDQNLKHYLNELSTQAHSVIYLPPKTSLFSGLVDLICVGFARCIARQSAAHLTSLLLLIVGMSIGYFGSLQDRQVAYALLPAGETRTPGSTREQLLEALRSGRDQGSDEKFLFASFLFQHNFKVGLLAMAAGVLAGVPTFFLMLYNGMLLGAFAAVHHMKGIDTEMWAWLLPHGITELGAIVLCGGLGLRIGYAVLNPEGIPRMTRLTKLGNDIAITAGGIGGMLVFAAIIESYLRQSHLSTLQRLVFAIATLIFWIVYIFWGFVAEARAR